MPCPILYGLIGIAVFGIVNRAAGPAILRAHKSTWNSHARERLIAQDRVAVVRVASIRVGMDRIGRDQATADAVAAGGDFHDAMF